MQTQDFSITVDRRPMPCYLARPDGNEPKPAVIVLQEIFGVNKEVKRICELFASAGYVGLGINYYFRTHPDLNEPYTPEGLQRGFQVAGQVTKANLRTDVAAAIDWLNGQSFVKNGKIATCGFCFGGTVAFTTATLPGLKAAIPFYGASIAGEMPSGEPGPLADVAEIEAPLLLFFGGRDDYIPPDAIEKIEDALTAAGKDYQVVVYPNVGHAFFRESSHALHQTEVKDAWQRVGVFLAEKLERGP